MFYPMSETLDSGASCPVRGPHKLVIYIRPEPPIIPCLQAVMMDSPLTYPTKNVPDHLEISLRFMKGDWGTRMSQSTSFYRDDTLIMDESATWELFPLVYYVSVYIGTLA
ncbi:hypothetical protein OCU04_003822 [Sclerotinia nivalis]|uniref:Uncharacterized protein n=1 Tax=Sclerotinia nivalis TaxID=352851 RepID=A0A9X0ASP6_9HELO|nr:hypothetical protein OCU04_003822 [Sclerotinia nivalis]